MKCGRQGWVAVVAGVAVAMWLGGTRAAEAEELALAIAAGRVTLTAAEVRLGDVLAEWSRVGNTRFEGVGALGSARVTLRLEGVPEREALRLLLRPAAGFVAAPRRSRGSAASIYDRVWIRADRRAPQAAPNGASQERRPPPPRPVREAPPVISAADQRERLRRLVRPGAPVGAAVDRPAAAPREGSVYAPTTPRPGMVVEAAPPDRRQESAP